MNKHPEDMKIPVVNRYLNGEQISKISHDIDISRTTVYTWIKQNNNSFNKGKIPNFRYLHELTQQFCYRIVFRKFKREALYRYRFKTEKDFFQSGETYMALYNNKRPHSVLMDQTPAKFEAKYFNAYKRIADTEIELMQFEN